MSPNEAEEDIVRRLAFLKKIIIDDCGDFRAIFLPEK